MPEWVGTLWMASCSTAICVGLQPSYLSRTPTDTGGSLLTDWRDCDGFQCNPQRKHRKLRPENGQQRLSHVLVLAIQSREYMFGS